MNVIRVPSNQALSLRTATSIAGWTPGVSLATV